MDTILAWVNLLNPTSSPVSRPWSMAASRLRRGRQLVGMGQIAN